LHKWYLIFLVSLIPDVALSQNLDIRLLRAIYSSETLPSDKFFRLASNSDTYAVIGTPVILGGLGLIRNDDNIFRNACVIMASTVINSGITTALKYSFHRDRPFVTYSDIVNKSDPDGLSFPSGHTSSAFATATSLSLAYPKWYIIVPSFAYAGTVAYSRLHLGVHYPSDVAAGALIGAGCAYLTYKVNKSLLNKHKIKPCNCPDL
jgi:membrane-associated phospholipid phosphatase